LAAAWLWCLLGIAAAALTLVTVAAAQDKLKDLGEAPHFTLEAYSGRRVTLTQVLQDGPAVIDFWATWCSPCREALPQLQALHEKYSERGLTVLAISQDDPRSQPKIGPFVRSQRLTFPVLLDGDHRVARLWRVSTLPTTFLVDPSGRIVALHRGYRDGDERILEDEILALLARITAAEDAR
jgi:peroxiredoxin